MPKCKNDPRRSYNGTEPSPKGLGYCAHAEKLCKSRRGKNGDQWVVKKTKNGVKRWTKEKPEGDFPSKITFSSPPFGIVIIKKGQFGYKKKTSIRLKRNKDGDTYFVAKSTKYIQDPKNMRIFRK